MKATDLMIGDYIFSKGKEIHSIRGLEEDENGRWWYYSPEHQSQCAVDEAQPIPFTPEILEKNGFYMNQDKDESWYEIKFNEDGIFGITRFENTDDWVIGYTEFPNLVNCLSIKYVHELQHAMKLCGIEKEIKL